MYHSVAIDLMHCCSNWIQSYMEVLMTTFPNQINQEVVRKYLESACAYYNYKLGSKLEIRVKVSTTSSTNENHKIWKWKTEDWKTFTLQYLVPFLYSRSSV
jgi:hypothetical protein